MTVRPITPTGPRRPARDVIASFPAFVAVNDGLGQFICVEPGCKGYMPFAPQPRDLEQADRIAARWGADRAPTEIEREAAYAGSMFGWDAPIADPLNYVSDNPFDTVEPKVARAYANMSDRAEREAERRALGGEA